MANVPVVKPIAKDVLGPIKKATTMKGTFGGGTPYNQCRLPTGFTIVKPRPGHSQKRNTK